MEYQTFLKEIKRKLAEELPEDLEIQDFQAVKNNGELKRGILLRRQRETAAPVIYMEEYFEEYCRGTGIENLTERLLRFYENVREIPDPVLEAENLSDYEKMKRKIVFRLVNRESNKEMLGKVPHYVHGELAEIFYILFAVEKFHAVSMLITKEYLLEWGIDQEALRASARENTPRLLPPELKDIQEMLKEYFPGRETGTEEFFRGRMYVLTNVQRNYGASVLFYPGLLEETGKIWEEDFFILPSSVHETLLIPESKSPSEKEMREAVYSINRTDVAREEWLSDHIYFYSRSKKQILDMDIKEKLC